LVDALAEKATVSPDGSLLAYSYTDRDTKQYKLAVAALTGGQPLRIFEHASVGFGNIRWTPDGRGLIFTNGISMDLELWPLAGGAPRTLVEHGDEELFSFDVSADGKRLAYTKGIHTSRLVLISDLK
jgi:dipeptidyl aminopeptidase/acylaminoacyl peptidase